MKSLLHFSCLFCLLVFTQQMAAQKRYKQKLFNGIDSLINLPYGEAENLKGERETLLLNLFMPPKEDTVKARPLVIFIHGGGFRNGDKTSSIIKKLALGWCPKGYVVASIDYRLGIAAKNTDADYHEALYRAQQDARAAVRFFRRYASEYSIDTTQIFLAGSSAGSMTALAVAYMDESEIPSDINQSKWGSLEGNSGNPGFSSQVQGVINNWGSMIDYRWIKKGDAPLFNVAGTLDKTVPYDSSYAYHSFKYGPYILYQHCLRIGVPTGWRPFENAGHTLDNNREKQDTAIREMESWLFAQLKVSRKTPDEGVDRWAAEFKRFDTLNRTEKHTDSALLFFGSSYIRLWKNIRQDLQYDDIIHRGFGGSNMRDAAYYVHRLVDPHHPKAIFMYLGNDIVDSDKDKSPEQVLELFKFVVKEIRTVHPSIPITWLKISPSEKRWGVWGQVQEANRLVEQWASTQLNLHCISFANAFLGEDGQPIKKLYINDKLHYNEDGYRVWGAAIREQVKQIIKN